MASLTGSSATRRRSVYAQLELALEEVMAERSKLWAELHGRAALEDEVAYYRAEDS